jgi:hypothetical protein
MQMVMPYKNKLSLAFGLAWLLLSLVAYAKYSKSPMFVFPYEEVSFPALTGLAFIVTAFWKKPKQATPPEN